jgi:hypothetical protein
MQDFVSDRFRVDCDTRQKAAEYQERIRMRFRFSEEKTTEMRVSIIKFWEVC